MSYRYPCWTSRGLTEHLHWKDALVHPRRTCLMHHVRAQHAVPYRGDGRTPVVPCLTLPDVQGYHFVHRRILRRPHHCLKASRSYVAWNALAEAETLGVVCVVELLVELRRDGHPSDEEDRSHLRLRGLRRDVLRVDTSIQVPDVCRADHARGHPFGPGCRILQP